MSFFDKIFGREKPPARPRQTSARHLTGYPHPPQGYAPQQRQQYGKRLPRPPAMSPDEQALIRYRYMLRTAPPATIEQAHLEAFTQLTAQQRHMIQQQLSAYLTPEQRAIGLGAQDDPASLARAATLVEIGRPGTLESIYRSNSTTPPATSPITSAGTVSSNMLMGTVIWLCVGGTVAHGFFANPMYGGGFDAWDGGGADLGGHSIGDFGGGDFGGDLGGIL